MLKSYLIATILTLTLALTACSPPSTSKSSTSQQPTTPQTSTRSREQQLAAIAQKLDAIPPPAKLRYMAVRSSTHWQNPFLTIHPHTVELRVSAPPASRSARRGHRRAVRPAPLWKTTTLSLDALPAALAALPANNWPYGRVIALRDDLSGSSSSRVQVRRNEENILNLLNNLGVVAYEWPRNRH